MPDTSNQTIETKKDNNQFDNLLIKDKSGNLSYYKKRFADKPATVLADTQSPLFDKPAALTDHNFVQDNYAKLRAKADSPADFSFHPDDQKYFEELSVRMPKDDSKKYGLEKIVSRLIEKQNLNFDAANRKFFSQGLFNFFRGRKDAVSTRQFLSQKVKLNHKNLTETTVDVIMSIIKGIKLKVEAAGGLVIEEKEIKAPSEPSDDKLELKAIVLEETPIDKPQEEINKALDEIRIKEEKISAPVEIKEEKPEIIKGDSLDKKSLGPQSDLPVLAKETKIDFKEDIQPIPVKLNSVSKNNSDFSIPPEKVETEAPDAQKPEAEVYLPKVNRPLATPVVRKQFTDVVSKPASDVFAQPSTKASRASLTGPIQELQTMNLVAFRRLGRTAQERANKILDKISLLEQDSFTKQAQGIQAWRNSELYRLYLQLGADSMVQGKQIGELLSAYQSEGKEALEIDEFTAISDLNKKIRF